MIWEELSEGENRNLIGGEFLGRRTNGGGGADEWFAIAGGMFRMGERGEESGDD